jgi:hypothetical protein
MAFSSGGQQFTNANRTQTNDDAYDTRNNIDGALGAGIFDDRANDMDLATKHKDAQTAIHSGDQSQLIDGSDAFSKANVSGAGASKLPTDPYKKQKDEHITNLEKKVDELQKGQTEIVDALKESMKAKEDKAADANQDLPLADVGEVPKGIPVEDSAVYVPPTATKEEVVEEDAAPKKPTPKVPEREAVAETSTAPGLPKEPASKILGQKRLREEDEGEPEKKKGKKDPYVAIKTTPDPPVTTETGGTKRGGDDPEIGPEQRGDLEASENIPTQVTEPTIPETVTDEPLAGTEE